MDSISVVDVEVEERIPHNWTVGLICCGVAALGFGSNYLPVKRVDCGDGFFFATCMSLGIGLVGLAVNFSELTTGEYLNGPEFQPIAMLGGAGWMLGNLLTPTVIRLIGLGVGLSVWDLSNMFMGWATGYFGLFGIWKEPIESPVMNFVGLGLAAVSLVVLTRAIEDETPLSVEASPSQREQGIAPQRQDESGSEHPIEDPELGSAGSLSEQAPSEVEHSAASSENDQQVLDEAIDDVLAKPVLPAPASSNAITTYASSGSANEDMSEGNTEAVSDMSEKSAAVQKSATPWSLNMRSSKIIGLLLALVAGVLFGSTFDSPTVLLQNAMDGDTRYSSNSLDYVFSSYVGIVLTGVASLLAYVCVMRKQAFIKSEIIFPGIASGVLWGIAQTAWFKANQSLSIVIAFPIISALPGIVAMMWGVLLFGELRTRRARNFAALAMALRIPSVVLIAMSDFTP